MLEEIRQQPETLRKTLDTGFKSICDLRRHFEVHRPRLIIMVARGTSDNAALFAANTLPVIKAIRQTGVTDLRGIAAALNARGVRTARGGRWHVSNVKNLVDRKF